MRGFYLLAPLFLSSVVALADAPVKELRCFRNRDSKVPAEGNVEYVKIERSDGGKYDVTHVVAPTGRRPEMKRVLLTNLDCIILKTPIAATCGSKEVIGGGGDTIESKFTVNHHQVTSAGLLDGKPSGWHKTFYELDGMKSSKATLEVVYRSTYQWAPRVVGAGQLSGCFVK